MSLILDRYLPTYRRELVEIIFAVTQQGGSLCLVGLAGAGKSNLCTFLEQPAVSEFYLPHSEAARTHFLPVACGTGAQSPSEIYAALYAPVSKLARDLGIAPGKPDGQPLYYALRELLSLLCRDRQQRIIFVLDEFENLIRHQPLELFEELRLLRDDHRTSGNLAYVVSTHRMPQLVVGNQPFAQSRLFELLRRELYPLGPYRREDARQMLRVLATRAKLSISDTDQEQLCALCGGHSGILYAVFCAIQANMSMPVKQIVRLAGQDPEVQKSCEHIWSHLHSDERTALLGIVEGQTPSPTMVEFLMKRGLLNRSQHLEIFAPVFREFVKLVSKKQAAAGVVP